MFTLFTIVTACLGLFVLIKSIIGVKENGFSIKGFLIFLGIEFLIGAAWWFGFFLAILTALF